ncbi:MAG TPA: putative molybdenum carrier protein [Rhodocyclaceae bacterium]|nr:putative molybdenum carrier protein [Rhodocyclaceae bacterium]
MNRLSAKESLRRVRLLSNIYRRRAMRSAQPISRIISGGQAGVDRAALDWALEHGLPHGGWCPKGRIAEDGPLDSRYALQETESAGYRQRTRQNVIDSDGTLILNCGELTEGSLTTLRFAERFEKPCLVVQLDEDIPAGARRAIEWIRTNGIAVLNVAGPRESKSPGIYRLALAFLGQLTWRCVRAPRGS